MKFAPSQIQVGDARLCATLSDQINKLVAFNNNGSFRRVHFLTFNQSAGTRIEMALPFVSLSLSLSLSRRMGKRILFGLKMKWTDKVYFSFVSTGRSS